MSRNSRFAPDRSGCSIPDMTPSFRRTATFARLKTAAWTKLGFVPGGAPPGGASPPPTAGPPPGGASPPPTAGPPRGPDPSAGAPPSADPSGAPLPPGGPPPSSGGVNLEMIVAMLDKFHEDVMTRLEEGGGGSGKKKKPSAEDRLAKIEQAMGIQQDAGGSQPPAEGSPAPSPAPAPAK